ncbi:MAG: exodeoxyribonuclease VII large subunit [Defluviitaleaceae bacterium]|nr:exodeoxyribonuclease VII large subunit [Defluviitaleaceae bacterium]
MKKVLTVQQINSYIRQLFDEDVILSEVFVQGEISNFKSHTHLYFTLKDDFATISCVMFASHASSLAFKLKNGQKVILFGRIGVYEKTGNYQIYVELVQPVGLGALHLAFEQLKEKLNSEGLFDSEHKKSLPENPGIVALVTSPTGAVVQDMIRIAKRRSPATNLLVVPTIVQGDDAPEAIANALYDLAEYGRADIAILARGGGSTEDLWAFNEEIVARAIFRFPLPIISAIGHETDFTISDFVADLRASTPSAAIEIALSDKNAQSLVLSSTIGTINNLTTAHLSDCRRKMTQSNDIINNKLDTLLAENRQNLRFLASVVNNLSPLNILEKGYSVVYKRGEAIRTAKQLNYGDKITIKFKDGEKMAEIF